MKKNGNYSQMRYEQEEAKKRRRAKEEEPEFHDYRGKLLLGELLPNYTDILLNNLLFILCSLPAVVSILLALMTGGTVFVLCFIAASALLGAAMSALYHRCYSYVRYIPKFMRESFFESFRKNFRQGAVCGLILGVLWTLLGFYSLAGQSQTEVQSGFYYVAVILCLFLVNYFTMTVMAQTSQFALPTMAVLKNGVLLLAACGWRGVVPALLQMLYIVLLLENLSAGMLLFFLGIPGIVFTVAAHFLWPRLSEILLREESALEGVQS